VEIKASLHQKTGPAIVQAQTVVFPPDGLTGVPLLCIGLLELGLRLVGFGYPTSFLLKSSNHGANTFVQNNQFGW